MKVVGLISGGKDSCYNMMKCVDDGHEIVCLANLKPPDGHDELDSYMYQTVGHDAIEVKVYLFLYFIDFLFQLYSEACGLPLYRRTIAGRPLSIDFDYEQTINDEVEDLYELLVEVKRHHPDIEGIDRV